MPSDRERWDAKYRAGWGREDRPLDPFVELALERLGPGAGKEALDLAAGRGRHALALAERGWTTAAWDVSPVALELLRRAADERGVEVATRALDLLDPELTFAPGFDLLIAVDFLDRPLWRRLHELVRPGGSIVLSVTTLDWTGAKPPPEYRLAPGEIERGVIGFEPTCVREQGGRAGYFGRRCDERPAAPSRPPHARREGNGGGS